MGWWFIIILLALVPVVLQVEAVFAPADLTALKAGWSSCKSENGGTGHCPTFVDQDDGSGMGSKNGLLPLWDVSRVTSFQSCECELFIGVLFFFSSSSIT